MREDTLKAATPSTRGTLIDLFSKAGVSPRRGQKLVDAILGNSKRTPMGLADFTPAGIPLAMERAAKQVRGGNYGTAALESLGAIPGGIATAATKPVRTAIQRKMQKPLGSFKLIQTDGGYNPEFTLVDLHDNKAVTQISGPKVQDNYQVDIRNAPNTNEARMLFEHGQINEKQLLDSIGMPASGTSGEQQFLRIPRESSMLDQLKLQGIDGIGNSTRSGADFGNAASKLKLAEQITQSKDIKKMSGNIEGSRVTGAKSSNADYGGSSMQRISIPDLVKRGNKRGTKAPENRTLPDVHRSRPSSHLPKDEAILGEIEGVLSRRRADKSIRRRPDQYVPMTAEELDAEIPF